ncbi:aldo/keto reductase [Streptomyces violaceusniger]|uniref:aldo/keto reductase n=1 Tax=Streptomyces violaceusniger TaxID=68280 RepID=UPI003428F46A
MPNTPRDAAANGSPRVEIGDHGLRLPRIGLGTASLGNFLGAITDEQAVDTIRRAHDAGIRYVDTAPLYGHGLAEQRIGDALRDKPREDLVISSKVGRLLRAGAPRDESQYVDGEPFYTDVPATGPVWDFSHDGVRTSLAESLDRLGLDSIDILHLHDPDDHYEQAASTAYAALRELRAEGRVKAIGAGMNRTPVLTRLVENCDLDVVLLAGRYTLLDQSSMADLLPACREHGTKVVVGGVFNSGILLDPSPQARYDYTPAAAAVVEKAQRIQAVCDRYYVPLAAAALQFPFAHPQVASVLVGARSVAELEMDLDLLKVVIPSALWHDLRASGLLPHDVPVPSGPLVTGLERSVR